MVEIRYGEQYEAADMAGQTVREAREQFRDEFGIPDKARARLNGSKVKEGLELDTVLNDDDKLSFAEATRGKGIYLIGALLLALAVTGGIFAYTATTDTTTVDLGASGEFATVANETMPTWSVFGHYKGKVKAGALFEITPSANYTGDLSATVMFANAHDMVAAYKVVVLEMIICDEDSGEADPDTVVAGPEYLSMGKGEVTFDIVRASYTPPFHVYIKSGFYITHHSWPSETENIQFLCDVTQKGAVEP
jgi:hypothetical protein